MWLNKLPSELKGYISDLANTRTLSKLDDFKDIYNEDITMKKLSNGLTSNNPDYIIELILWNASTIKSDIFYELAYNKLLSLHAFHQINSIEYGYFINQHLALIYAYEHDDLTVLRYILNDTLPSDTVLHRMELFLPKNIITYYKQEFILLYDHITYITPSIARVICLIPELVESKIQYDNGWLCYELFKIKKLNRQLRKRAKLNSVNVLKTYDHKFIMYVYPHKWRRYNISYLPATEIYEVNADFLRWGFSNKLFTSDIQFEYIGKFDLDCIKILKNNNVNITLEYGTHINSWYSAYEYGVPLPADITDILIESRVYHFGRKLKFIAEHNIYCNYNRLIEELKYSISLYLVHLLPYYHKEDILQYIKNKNEYYLELLPYFPNYPFHRS